MSFSTNLLAVSRALIQKYGQSMAIERVAEGAYDPTDGTVAIGTTTNYTVFGAPVDYTSNEVDNTNIRVGDIKVWLEKPTTETPLVGDVVTIDSADLRIVDIVTLKAQGLDVVYKLQCRV
jgi:hypothetical protein|tara:strand:+ start:460 stop:819 length:360 start_codon:yes stop_codon:yes gene_type:complete